MQKRQAVVEARRLVHVLLQEANHRFVQAHREVEVGVVAGRVGAELDQVARLLVARVQLAEAPRRVDVCAAGHAGHHARHNKARDLIQLGAYAPGHDAELDLAVRLHGAMSALLQQGMHESANLDTSVAQLRSVVEAR